MTDRSGGTGSGVTEHRGELRLHGPVAIVVSGYHERITSRLLEGALRCCREAGSEPPGVEVAWVAGAFELGVVAGAMARTGRFGAVIALGAVVRGETPHFDYVAGETTRMLGQVAVETGTPVGFGLLTVDTIDQAADRAGGSAGNKGYEAAEAAIRAADTIRWLRSR